MNARLENHIIQEKTSAAAAPRKPKKGAVSSPLKLDIAANPNPRSWNPNPNYEKKRTRIE